MRKPTPQDVAVGHRIKALRLERRISQQALGKHLGLSLQQIQKYEKGVNRVTATRLQQISEVFGVSVTALYGPTDEGHAASNSLLDLLNTATALRLLRAFSRIRDRKLKNALIVLAEVLGTRN